MGTQVRLITGDGDIVIEFPDERSRQEFDKAILEAEYLEQPWEEVAARFGGRVVAEW